MSTTLRMCLLLCIIRSVHCIWYVCSFRGIYLPHFTQSGVAGKIVLALFWHARRSNFARLSRERPPFTREQFQRPSCFPVSVQEGDGNVARTTRTLDLYTMTMTILVRIISTKHNSLFSLLIVKRRVCLLQTFVGLYPCEGHLHMMGDKIITTS